MKKREIEVDDEVFEALQALAAPLLDTPNSVLRRLLRLESAPEKRISTHFNAPGPNPSLGVDVGHVTEEARGAFARRPERDPDGPLASYRMASPVQAPGQYASLGSESRAATGMSPRRFGKLLCAREYPGEMFERARRDRGAFRTMFESDERLLYFLNFNKPGATNLWYKVPSTALQALVSAEKPASVVFVNPAERVAWAIPLEVFQAKYREMTEQALGVADVDVNLDVKGNRVREWDWDIREWRREV